MNRVLTVQNAEIKTAAVEIKTLTVSGKQVTLAVFRQLQEAPLINRDGSLRGIPWGVVNYHPDKCADDKPHWHVVWQDGTELRRGTVYRDVRHSGMFDGSLAGPGMEQQVDRRILSLLQADEIDELKKFCGSFRSDYGSGAPYRDIKFGPDEVPTIVHQTMGEAAACAAWLGLSRHNEKLHVRRSGYYGDEPTASEKTGEASWNWKDIDTPRYLRSWARSAFDLTKPIAVSELYPVALELLERAVSKYNPIEARQFNVDTDAEIATRAAYLKTLATIPALPHLFIAV